MLENLCVSGHVEQETLTVRPPPTELIILSVKLLSNISLANKCFEESRSKRNRINVLYHLIYIIPYIIVLKTHFFMIQGVAMIKHHKASYMVVILNMSIDL